MEARSSISGGFGRPGHSSEAGGMDGMFALADILHDHRPRIFRFLLASFADPGLARTLTERCLETACWEWRPSWDKSHIRLRLMRIAVNLERHCWRRQQLCFWRKVDLNAAGLVLLNSVQQDNQQPSEYQIRTRKQIRQIWNAVSTMKNQQRVVFLLYCVEEMDLCEITEATDIHESRVRKLLLEALGDVRTALGENAISLEPEY